MTERQTVSFNSRDGLSLYATVYGRAVSSRLPVLCLAGLTRNSKDFEPLLAVLPGDRLMITPDYRGRGRSQYAADWRTYTPKQELEDAIALLDHLEIPEVAVIGTSRGGIIALLMAERFASRLAGAVLNDIGPKIEVQGLARIARMVSAKATSGSWPEAIASLKNSNPGLYSLSERDWDAFARRVFIEKENRIVADFDSNLSKTFPTVSEIAASRISEMWESFAALASKPCGVLRGEHSDLLSPATVEQMKEIHPGLLTASVRNRGHVPFLDEPESVALVKEVLAQCDRRRAKK